MKNKATWIVAILVIIILGAGLAYRLIYIANHPPVYIAVFVPGEEGDDAIATENTLVPIQMYLEAINAKGGINGHPLKLVVKEDGGTVTGAEQAISEINAENQAMIVLGHAYSDPASAIGPKLTEYGIPAITSGATAPQVTIDHPWFYRVVTNNTSQGKSIAAYAVEVLGMESAIIVYEDNKYGQSLGDGFEKYFRSLGGTVFTKSPVDSESETLEQDVAKIIIQIDEVPDMVFLATYKTSGAATVIALKENNINALIVGGDDIGDTAFIEVFPDEIQRDIHYLNNIYAASPLIFDVASEDAQLFKERYVDRTDKIPTWFCATSYDSILVAVQAMLDAGISADPAQLSADRQKVRDQLAKYNSSTTAVPGITGDLYFDKTNDVVQPAAMGIFVDQNFISAPIQIQLVKHSTQIDNLTDSHARGDLFYIDGQPVYKTKIVYVGTDINEFSKIDIDDEHNFTVDFYLWFRYTGDLEIENIVFDNVAEPVELELIKTAQYGDVTYKLFRAKATFSGSYDLFQYPFDHHKLRISFATPTMIDTKPSSWPTS